MTDVFERQIKCIFKSRLRQGDNKIYNQRLIFFPFLLHFHTKQQQSLVYFRGQNRMSCFSILLALAQRAFYQKKSKSKLNIKGKNMGSVLSEARKIYVYEWVPPQDDIYTVVSNLNSLPSPLDGKIIIPLSSINHKRNFILQNHHKVVLISDAPQLQQMVGEQFKGIPLIRESDLIKNPKAIFQLEYDNKQCPVPLILQKFHESYVKNYLNAFNYYGIKVWCYDRIDHYLRSSCTHPYLICSNYELEQLALKIHAFAQRQQRQYKFTILCFCDKLQYTIPKRTELILQKSSIEVVLFQNILDIVDRLSGEVLCTPSGLQIRVQKVLFLLDEKEKEMEYLLKMGKKVQKSIRNVHMLKVLRKTSLLNKIEKQNYSIVIVGNENKDMRNLLELQDSLEQQGLEDRIIVVRRDAEMSQKVIHRLQHVVTRQKYVKVRITEKPIVFYGTLDYFKYTLKNYPHLSFKLFIDSNRDTTSLAKFLSVQTQVVMTHLRICPCQPEFTTPIACKIILIKARLSILRSCEKIEAKPCQLQKWFVEEDQVIDFFNHDKSSQILALSFDYRIKKMGYLAKILSQTFAKLKQKKTILINTIINSAFLFSCEYYALQQMSTYIIRYFSCKLLGNYEQDCMFPHLRSKLHEQLTVLRNVKGIEEEVLIEIQKQQSQNVYQLAHLMAQLMMAHPLFLEEVNNVWSLFLQQDRAEYLNHCQITFFLIFLNFSKANFVQFSNQNVQNIMLAVKIDTISYDPQELVAFTRKNRGNFAYNADFIIAQEYTKGQLPNQSQILIKIQGNELTNFNLFMSLCKKDGKVLIPPFSKFQINSKQSPQHPHLLKLSLNSQHKLLQKFSQIFLQENGSQLKLFNQQRQMRKLDVFLQNMSRGIYQTAGYILKRLLKEETAANADLINAYAILYHLKKNQVEQAQTKLRKDKYYELLAKVIASIKVGQEQKTYLSDTNKRIEDNNDYQNLDSEYSAATINKPTTQTMPDPQMIRKISGVSFNENNRSLLEKPISFNPCSLKERAKKDKQFFIYNTKCEPDSTSLTDAISQHSMNEDNPKILVSSPCSKLANLEQKSQAIKASMFENTFAVKASDSLRMQDKKTDQNQNINDLMRLICQLSEAGSDNSSNFQDPVIKTSLQVKSLSKKGSGLVKQPQSLFKEFQQQKQNDKNNDHMVDSAENDDAFRTAIFNFNSWRSQDHAENQVLSQQSDIIIEEEELLDQSDKHSNISKQQDLNFTTIDLQYFKGSASRKKKMFPIKRKTTNHPKSILNEDSLLPPLGKIEEETESQGCLTSTNNFHISPSDKENRSAEFPRNKNKKLFTFCKESDAKNSKLKKRTSLFNAISKQAKDMIAEIQQQNPLLITMHDNEEKHDLDQINSISSIAGEDAEQIHPETFKESFNAKN